MTPKQQFRQLGQKVVASEVVRFYYFRTVCADSKRIILNMTGVTNIDGSCTGEVVAVSTAGLT